MNKQEFINVLNEKIKQEHLDYATKVHGYLFANETIADYAVRLLFSALDSCAGTVIEMAKNENVEFMIYNDRLKTVAEIKGMKTYQEKIDAQKDLYNEKY